MILKNWSANFTVFNMHFTTDTCNLQKGNYHTCNRLVCQTKQTIPQFLSTSSGGKQRSFNILGLQQIAIGALDKSALSDFWTNLLGEWKRRVVNVQHIAYRQYFVWLLLSSRKFVFDFFELRLLHIFDVNWLSTYNFMMHLFTLTAAGVEKVGSYRSEKENVDEDILSLGAGQNKCDCWNDFLNLHASVCWALLSPQQLVFVILSLTSVQAHTKLRSI